MTGDYAKVLCPLITLTIIASAAPSEKWAPGTREIISAIGLTSGLATLFIWPLSKLVNDVAAIRKELEDSTQNRNIN